MSSASRGVLKRSCCGPIKVVLQRCSIVEELSGLGSHQEKHGRSREYHHTRHHACIVDEFQVQLHDKQVVSEYEENSI